MTFKDLQKVIESQPGQGLNQNQLQRLRDKPFWYWDRGTHKERDRVFKGDCCMQHIIGLPKKDGKEMPLFDYERMLYKALLEPGYFNSYPRGRTDPNYSSSNILHPFKEKHLWCLKATGLGCSEFFLRFMAWLCLRNDECRGSQMVIVTGPNQELAIKLIKRMKALFEPKLGITFDTLGVIASSHMSSNVIGTITKVNWAPTCNCLLRPNYGVLVFSRKVFTILLNCSGYWYINP